MTSQPSSTSALPTKEGGASIKPRPPRRQKPDYRHIHRFSLPLKVHHPLPPLIPHNPLSIISVLLSYLTYFITTPKNETYSAYFDSSTSSIHVTDEKTVRALWEMGFFGKGSLSRSEPTWLDQEKKRRGLLEGVTSEEVTRQRRAERRELKLQRARSEKLIIEQRLQAEAAAREGHTADVESVTPSSPANATNGVALTAEKFSVKKAREARFIEAQQLARRDREANGKAANFTTTDGNGPTQESREKPLVHEGEETTITNEEHLQLSNEEALFLVYGLGALHVFDQDRKTVLSSDSLLRLFCHHSHTPPRDPTLDLKPDDPFLVSYVVYHHFRSLGWIVRSGVKFGVDYIIYNRGPVFSHAEFAIVVIPSYEHPYWSETEDRKAECSRKQARSWWWLHCVNRVQAQVKKTLVVCYVEIPPPSQELEHVSSAGSMDIGALLTRYGTQEDSIDIARLQRVALGLVSSYSIIESTPPQNRRDLAQLPHPDDLPASRNGPRESVADGAITNGKTYITEALELNRQSPKQSPRPPLPVPPTAKMSSADALPSDTQVISQSVYDEIIRKNKEASKDGPDSNVLDRATLLTLHEGDSGHIDLLAGFDGTNVHPPNTDENDDQSSSRMGGSSPSSPSSPLTYEPNLFPESQRFVSKTPVNATKQHHVEGIATVSPLVSRNPLAPGLGSGSGVMALSQVFQATQAPSSPLVNPLRPDLLSDRPSPNIPIQHRPLAPALSSPFNTIAATFPRGSSETQLNYVTMKESQANRERERMTRSADHIYSEDQSDGEFDKEPSFIENARRKRKIDQEVAAQFAALSAPARPSSRSEQQPGLSEAFERRGSADKAAVTSDVHAVGMSEEETEQEEEVPEPVILSQVPNSLTEEDKENCDDPTTVGLSHTASAHDRLSQALSFHGSPVATRERIQPLSPAQSQTRDDDLEAVNALKSSPVTVVKDSQWSPGRNDEDEAGPEIAASPTKRHGARLQSRSTIVPKRDISSPTKRVTIMESPGTSQRYDDRPRPGFTNSGKTSNPSGDASPDPQARISSSSNTLIMNGTGDLDKALIFDPRGKSSSMPSRVAETPVRRRQVNSNDLPTFATIPETSPNNMNHDEGLMSDVNNEGADQEDDDLPPPYPRTFERASQSQPVVSESSSPIKHLLNSKILSSPSGRQRRALTEIAADASPQVGVATFDININILSADDQEFRSAIAMSPLSSRKKRRSNDGRGIPASDPIVPATPRQTSRYLIPPPQEEEEASPSNSPDPMETAMRRQTSFSGRTKPPRRSGSIWDVEDAPKLRVSSKERSKIFARSLTRERQQPQPQESPEPQRREEPEPKEPLQHAQDEPIEVPASTPISAVPDSEPLLEASPAHEAQQTPPESDILAPNQVLAPWRGRQRVYYPATCFGKPFGTAQDQYLVKFEDSAPLGVPIGSVKRLEFRIGDAVKVDMPNVPKVTHIIRGFANKLSGDELSSEAAKELIPVTDIYGHSTLVLGPKQRKSLPSGGISVPENVISVPISRIYLDTILWNQLKDRQYNYISGSRGSNSRLQTPSDRHITPTSPSTRMSRSFRPSNGLFSGMVFAVSYGDKSEAKNRITKMILENDGRILEDGFNELFELPLNAPIATPAKSPGSRPAELNVNLRLKSGVEEVGFTCLVADKHSRRPKYMQALALNLPCLSDRWVEDCVAKSQILNWELYLLPAGESSYLNGATKSRILTPYPTSKAKLSETVAARPNLLSGQSVLLITGRNGKADEERRKAYLFLTYALGASKIERVPDIQSARAILEQSHNEDGTSIWDWIYIDDDDKATKAMAASAGGSVLSKKRRKSRLMESTNGGGLGLDTNVRVVGNEFVCQSLILGRLVD
ncbi:hypothetical protein BJX66DRAFT_351322 [Aspergillus keveii]|uniref:tRNA-intron lyase n=1 Tax=Aspergillus keveii TaxID=714993 RepID=A0ABR4G552_9EURO